LVYLTNRTFPAREGGREASQGGEDNLAVYALDQDSGEPKPIQHIDGCGVQLRTFGIDASGRLLIATSIMPMLRSDGIALPAGMTVRGNERSSRAKPTQRIWTIFALSQPLCDNGSHSNA